MSRKANLRQAIKRAKLRPNQSRTSIERVSLALAIAAALAAIAQTFVMARQFALEKATNTAIIRSQNIYSPLAKDPKNPSDVTHHSLVIIGNTELVASAFVENVSVAGFVVAFLDKTEPRVGVLEIPILNYFQYCDVEISFVSREIGRCYGENNFSIPDRINKDLEGALTKESVFRLAGIRNYSKVTVHDVEGKEHIKYLVTSEIGMLENSEEAEKFELLNLFLKNGHYVEFGYSVEELVDRVVNIYGDNSIIRPTFRAAVD